MGTGGEGEYRADGGDVEEEDEEDALGNQFPMCFLAPPFLPLGSFSFSFPLLLVPIYLLIYQPFFKSPA